MAITSKESSLEQRYEQGESGQLKSVRSSRGLEGDVGCKEHLGKGVQEQNPLGGFGWRTKEMRIAAD